MALSFKKILGALLFDTPIYLYCFVRQALLGEQTWVKVRDRDQELVIGDNTIGVACTGKWTSMLYLPSVFPWFGNKLYEIAFAENPIEFGLTKQSESKNPDVSFIIGHRGVERLPLLLKTLESISAQTDCDVECIVVEQDTSPRIKHLLPDWIHYIFINQINSSMPYSRSLSFNVGATNATSNNLIFHDNDLLIPINYASETLSRIQQGFEFVNLKRFIFYLDQPSTNAQFGNDKLLRNCSIESIMQNAQGGGSVGATKKAFQDIGGFDESFVGWGGEDNEFWERAQTKRVWPYAYLPLVHLWHSPQPEKENFDDSPTKRIYQELSAKPPKARIDELRVTNSKYNEQ